MHPTRLCLARRYGRSFTNGQIHLTILLVRLTILVFVDHCFEPHDRAQIREIMDKDLPDVWKQVISHKVENNLFSKVAGPARQYHDKGNTGPARQCRPGNTTIKAIPGPAIASGIARPGNSIR